MKKANVIKKYSEYQEIIKLKNYKRTNNYTIYLRKTNESLTRVGLLVGKKNGNAVARNRIKRQVRMITDSVLTYTEHADIIIAISKDYNPDEFLNNKNELVKLLTIIKGEING